MTKVARSNPSCSVLRRLIYASSNHVHHGTHMLDGQHERMDPSQLGAHVGRTISLDETLWPDSYYAVGKVRH